MRFKIINKEDMPFIYLLGLSVFGAGSIFVFVEVGAEQYREVSEMVSDEKCSMRDEYRLFYEDEVITWKEYINLKIEYDDCKKAIVKKNIEKQG